MIGWHASAKRSQRAWQDFKATQEKFKREREEYCTTTLDNARFGVRSHRSLERTLSWP